MCVPPELGSTSTEGRQYRSLQCWRMNSTKSSGRMGGAHSDGIATLGCMCVCVWRPLLTKGWLTPSLQANTFVIRLNKKVLHTHILRYHYVLERRGEVRMGQEG